MVLTMGTKQQEQTAIENTVSTCCTIAMNIFAMANEFVLYVIMKVEIQSHVVISFSSIKHARTYNDNHFIVTS